jgi:hypothetical protein
VQKNLVSSRALPIFVYTQKTTKMATLLLHNGWMMGWVDDGKVMGHPKAVNFGN